MLLRFVKLSILSLFLMFCKPADLNNPSDPNSELYFQTLLLRALLPVNLQNVTFEGRISGLIPNSSLTLTLNDSQNFLLSNQSNGNFSFLANLKQDESFSITISSQPNQLLCSFQAGSQGIANLNTITGLIITCPIALVAGLKWNRCSHGQTWDESANSGAGQCVGTHLQAQYCSLGTNDCNGGTNTGFLVTSALWTAGATSSAWNACNSLNSSAQNFGITTWRLPSKNELKSLRICNNDLNFSLDSSCPNTPASIISPTINTNLFPNTIAQLYSSSESNSLTSYWQLNFNNGSVPMGGSKTGNDYIRCVSN